MTGDGLECTFRLWAEGQYVDRELRDSLFRPAGRSPATGGIVRAVALIGAIVAVVGVVQFGAALGFLWVLFVGTVVMAIWLGWLL